MFLYRYPHLLGALFITGAMLPGQAFSAPAKHKVERVRKHHVRHAAPSRHVRQAHVRHPVYAPRPHYYAAPVVKPSYGAPLAAPVEPAPGWLVTLNAKAFLSPRYPGAKVYSITGYPTLTFRRPGEPTVWFSPDDTLNYRVYQTPYFAVGPVVGYRGGRYSENEGGELHGIHKSKWTLEPGVFADVWVMPDVFRIHGEVRRGFRDEDGFVGSIGADWVSHWDRFTFGIGPRAKFGNDHYMNQLFSITPQDAAVNPHFTPFKAGAGLYALGGYGSVTYKQDENWSYTLHGGYDRLTEDAARSPIVKATGSKDQFTVGGVVSYTFGWNGF